MFFHPLGTQIWATNLPAFRRGEKTTGNPAKDSLFHSPYPKNGQIREEPLGARSSDTYFSLPIAPLTMILFGMHVMLDLATRSTPSTTFQ